MTLKTMVTMANAPYKINRKKKRGGGGEWEGVGVVTAWWVNRYLNFMPGYYVILRFAVMLYIRV